MMYKRSIEDDIKKHFFQKKVIVLYGPRQVGKTTLVKKLYDEYNGEKVFFQCDIPSVRESLFVKSPEELKSYFRSAKLVILDEAQTVPEIGLMLKIFIDTYPDVQIIATGSSSFDLANKIREPLTGRAIEYMLYPLSVEEIVASDNLLMYKRKESLYFRYGLYPGILDLSETEAENRLGTLQNNTFYKDITLHQCSVRLVYFFLVKKIYQRLRRLRRFVRTPKRLKIPQYSINFKPSKIIFLTLNQHCYELKTQGFYPAYFC